MTRYSWIKATLCLLCLSLVLPLPAAETNTSATVTSTNYLFTPTRDQANIAFVTARLIEARHYTAQMFDTSISEKFYDEYIQTFDPQHLHFTQADMDEFDHYRTNLDVLTIARPMGADLSPAYQIYARFMQRLSERVAYVDELLKTEKFKFDKDERIVVDRKEAAYPADLDAAKKLWEQRLRYEYLTEKIAHIEAEKKKTNIVASRTDGKIDHLSSSLTNAPLKEDAIPDLKGQKMELATGGLQTTNNRSLAADITATNTPPKTMEQDIVDTLTRRYHRNLRFYQDQDSDDVLQAYLSALARAYDPHSEYFGKAAMDQFAMQMNLALFGIGAELSTSDDGLCTIQKLMPGGPAIKSGKLKETDRIVAVAQGDQPPVDVVDMSITKIVQMIRGAKGTEVRLTISPANSAERHVVSLIRDEIALPDQAAKEKLVEFPTTADHKVKIGVIDLPSFYAPVDLGSGNATADAKYTSQDVATLLNKLKEEHVDGVILDLRRNGGGSLEEAIKLTGLFIKDGPVVQVRASDGSVQVDEDTDPSIAYDGPLIVLTSRFSASASEIVAGALQDYGRALIVGDVSTHGKGTVQNVNPLSPFIRYRESTNDPGYVKITIRKFYRASGASTQFKGVMPDIVLPSPLNYLHGIGELSLDNPLPWDVIPSAKFDPVNMVQPYLAELLKRSSQRVATNQDFTYVREDIDQVRKKQDDKTASLNEQFVLKEMDEQQAREAARDKERASRKSDGEVIYDIDLKQAQTPGLPLAEGKTNQVASAEVLPMIDDDTETATKGAPVDVDLAESERIMVDYLSLLAKSNLAATMKN